MRTRDCRQIKSIYLNKDLDKMTFEVEEDHRQNRRMT